LDRRIVQKKTIEFAPLISKSSLLQVHNSILASSLPIIPLEDREIDLDFAEEIHSAYLKIEVHNKTDYLLIIYEKTI